MAIHSVKRATANPAADVLELLQDPAKYLDKIATLERWTAEHNAAADRLSSEREELATAERTAEERHKVRVAELEALQARPGEMLATARAEMLEAIDLKLKVKRYAIGINEWMLDEPEDHPGRDERVAEAKADIERMTAQIAALEERRKEYA